jgi:hypothetical protein
VNLPNGIVWRARRCGARQRSKGRRYMPKKKPVEAEFLLFDVLYQDGTRTSNRKIASTELDPLAGEQSVLAAIEKQDRKIAEMSGNRRGPIKTSLPSRAVT